MCIQLMVLPTEATCFIFCASHRGRNLSVPSHVLPKPLTLDAQHLSPFLGSSLRTFVMLPSARLAGAVALPSARLAGATPPIMGKRARDAPAGLRASLNVKGMSKKALAEVTSRLLGEDSEACSWMVKRESESRFQHVRHTFQLPAEEGEGPVSVVCCHPLKTLDLLLRESDALQGWYLEALRRHPCSAAAPWRLLLGWDEFVPGNKAAL